MTDNILNLPKPKKQVKLEMPIDEATASWKSLKCMLDNSIPHPSEVPLLIRAMQNLAKAIDEANNEQSIS